MKLRQTKYVIGIVFILIGIGIIVATTLPKSMQYYVTVDELLAAERTYIGKELKVAGTVSQNSVVRPGNGLQIQFQVENANKVIQVSYNGAVPDTFKEGAEVVVTGTLTDKGRVEASHVLAKCASRYEEKLQPTLVSPEESR